MGNHNITGSEAFDRHRRVYGMVRGCARRPLSERELLLVIVAACAVAVGLFGLFTGIHP